MLIQRSPQTGSGLGATVQLGASSSMLVAALSYAASGVPVFPCIPRGKRPLTRHGFKDATTDATLITSWWRRWSTANLAMPTGSPGFDVFDVDVRRDGDGLAAMDRARRLGLLTGMCGRVTTPSGGFHLYFLGSDQPSSTLAGQHLDFKGRGGYVLLPPSCIEAEYYAGTYRWDLGGLRRGGQQLDWTMVRSYLSPRRSGASTDPPDVTGQQDGLAQWLGGVHEGDRNDSLFWACCERLRSGSTDLSDLRDVAIGLGLESGEVATTIASARRKVTVHQ